MRTILLPTLLLLGASVTHGYVPKITIENNLAQVQLRNAATPDNLTEFNYHFEAISDYSIQQITTYWQNRTNGTHCIQIFGNITEQFSILQKVAYDISGLIEQYNSECNDKCLPGYVKCANGPTDKCILECECCSLQKNAQDKALVCCDTQNHNVNDVNYALGDDVLHCYDFCCPDVSTFCVGTCFAPNAPLPAGFSINPSNPLADEEYGYGYEDGTITVPVGGNVCCEGNACCPAGEIWPSWLSPEKAECCVSNTVIGMNSAGENTCCCDSEESICCPNLADNVCQPATNPYCCPAGETYCTTSGKCQSIPCCPVGENNCQYQDNACVAYCCCDELHKCCDERESCILKDDICCPLGQTVCNGVCQDETIKCCDPNTPLCSFSGNCEEHCCDKVNGFTWCEYTGQCETHCCPKDQVWCDGSSSCIIVGQPCCPQGEEYCQWTKQCQAYTCCEYSSTKHEIFCDIHKECRDECDCCAVGGKQCQCVSGVMDTDKQCYSITSQECCKEFWCEKHLFCVADEFACCEYGDSGTYVGDKTQPYDATHCCAFGSNEFSIGENSNGCCIFVKDVTDTCCKADSNGNQIKFNELSKTCDKPQLEPCPCDGCCDFNCCDELDFFMHKAYVEYYNSSYESFDKFYEALYSDFVAWWESPSA